MASKSLQTHFLSNVLLLDSMLCLAALLVLLLAMAPAAEARNFSVKDQGAVGNGITDDTEAIIQTIQRARQASGKNSVFFPPGNYLHGLISANDVTLFGQEATLTGIDTISLTGECTVRDLEITSKNGNGTGIQASAPLITLSNLNVHHFDVGIDVGGSSCRVIGNHISDCNQTCLSVSGSDNEVADNTINDDSGQLIFLLSASSATVRGNSLTGNADSTTAIKLSRSSDCTIVENKILDAFRAVSDFGGNAILVTENSVSGSFRHAFFGDHTTSIKIKANKVEGTGNDAQNAVGSFVCRDLQVTDNEFIGMSVSGISSDQLNGGNFTGNHIARTSTGINLSSSQNVTISSNRLSDCGAQAVFLTKARGTVLIEGNQISNIGNQGIQSERPSFSDLTLKVNRNRLRNCALRAEVPVIEIRGKSYAAVTITRNLYTGHKTRFFIRSCPPATASGNVTTTLMPISVGDSVLCSFDPF